MNDITPSQIQEKFDALPENMKRVLSSPDIHARIRKIGSDQNLMIDAIGELVDQVGLVILGLAKSSSFVSDISARLSIDNERAQGIANQINTEVFGTIKNELQQATPRPITAEQRLDSSIPKPAPTPPPRLAPRESHLSALERAGKFEIEREAPTPTNVSFIRSSTPETRNDIIRGLEGTGIVTKNRTLEQNVNHLVDQLMSRPTATPAESIVRTPEPISKPPVPPVQQAPVPPRPSTQSNQSFTQRPVLQGLRQASSERFILPTSPVLPPENLPTGDLYKEDVK